MIVRLYVLAGATKKISGGKKKNSHEAELHRASILRFSVSLISVLGCITLVSPLMFVETGLGQKDVIYYPLPRRAYFILYEWLINLFPNPVECVVM
jgi:hypothetical protein